MSKFLKIFSLLSICLLFFCDNPKNDYPSKVILIVTSIEKIEGIDDLVLYRIDLHSVFPNKKFSYIDGITSFL